MLVGKHLRQYSIKYPQLIYWYNINDQLRLQYYAPNSISNYLSIHMTLKKAHVRRIVEDDDRLLLAEYGT